MEDNENCSSPEPLGFLDSHVVLIRSFVVLIRSKGGASGGQKPSEPSERRADMARAPKMDLVSSGRVPGRKKRQTRV